MGLREEEIARNYLDKDYNHFLYRWKPGMYLGLLALQCRHIKLCEGAEVCLSVGLWHGMIRSHICTYPAHSCGLVCLARIHKGGKCLYVYVDASNYACNGTEVSLYCQSVDEVMYT